MKQIIVRQVARDPQAFLAWVKEESLLDLDLFNHDTTFVLRAQSGEYVLAYLPVQQPLMMESVIFDPGMADSHKGIVMARLCEHVISEAYRREVPEIYFLSQYADTAKLAERHGFKPVPLAMMRLNLRETFGES